MAFVVPTVARSNLLGDLKASRLTGALLCLYSTNHAPLITDVLATYTAIESAFPGYARITLNSWGAVSIDAQNNAECDETARTFTASGSSSEHAYGYFIIDGAGALLFAELDPGGGQDMNATGKTYTITPKVYLGPLSGPPFLRPRPASPRRVFLPPPSRTSP